MTYANQGLSKKEKLIFQAFNFNILSFLQGVASRKMKNAIYRPERKII